MNAERYRRTVSRSAATAIAEQLPESVASAAIELISGPLAETTHDQALFRGGAVFDEVYEGVGVGGHGNPAGDLPGGRNGISW